ncbi:MAG TPA: ABC transporter substrate-binding protein, partial [Oscillospiraceae bacterium]|nr:ABC transporter substrate-binding protein [Oscillospiraceae bacterium]
MADPAAPDLSGPSAAQESAADPDAPVVDGLIYASTMKLDYAECFDVYFYEGGYAVVEIDGSRGYLVVPEGAEVPAGAEGRFLVLRRPLDRIYLAATSAMCLFDALDGLSGIRFSGTRADGWYIESAVRAMEEGDILYAGKYNAPDYELILS